jgi:hypothetical protein
MSDRDIYQILESLDAAQRSVKQLPALFKPKDTSPQLSGPYPGRNATRGYLVGEGEEDINPMAQAVTRRIVNQHPEWIMRYGVEFLMQVIDDVTEGEDWEEIGSSDVSAYVNMVHDQLRDRGGDRDEMADRKPFAEEDSVRESLRDGEYHVATVTLDDGSKKKIKIRSDEGFREPIEKHFAKQGRKVVDIDVDYSVRSDVYEGRDTATEDVLSTMKKKLGDYLQDVATAIKKDPDLIDQVPGDIDQIRAVKTIRTDDGHEIKIHGTEDDGFRISRKNKNLKTEFRDLDEAVMAAEMYCARRRQQSETADYIDEKTS